MTTIAFDGVTIAADSLQTFGCQRAPGTFAKLRWHNGVLFAVTGASGAFTALVQWYFAGAAPEKAPKVDGATWTLIVINGGDASVYTSTVPYAEPLSAPFAYGSGADFALGAMAVGATAAEAVAAAVKLDVWSGPPITSFRVRETIEGQAS